MNDNVRSHRSDDDDSLLASVAGVPLTRMARIGACFIWAAFWAARILLTDAPSHFQDIRLKLAISESLGDSPVDQAFSICMIWLTVEIVATVWTALKKQEGKCLLLKQPPGSDSRLRRP